MKEPLYSYDSEFGWNYGAIGATIGHEICHAFDLGGSMFSPIGRFKRWWTRKNYMKFRVQTRKVVAFYNKFKHPIRVRVVNINFNSLIITFYAFERTLTFVKKIPNDQPPMPSFNFPRRCLNLEKKCFISLH